MINCGVFIDFDIPPGYYPRPIPGSGATETVGIHRNHFNDLQCQSDAGLIIGLQFGRSLQHSSYWISSSH